jgi:hypothetical protein
MKRLLQTVGLCLAHAFLIGQNVGIGTASPLIKLHVVGGSNAGFSSGAGYLGIGNTNTANLILDADEILARINGLAGNLYLNRNSGNINLLGEGSNGNVGINILNPTQRLHLNNGNIKLDNSLLGIILNAADQPLITRLFDPFTSGIYNGVGRWGLFMEPSRLTLGIPDVVGKAVQVASYSANSTATTVLTIDRVGQVKRPKTGDFDLLPIAMAYVKWDGTLRRSTGNVSITRTSTGAFWSYAIKLIPEEPVQFASLTLTSSDYRYSVVYGDYGASVLVERKSDSYGDDFTIIMY